MNSIDSKIAAHEEEIRRLKLLRDLLRNPELAAIAKEQLLKSAEVSTTPQQQKERETPRSRRRTGRKRQLKKRALEIVMKSTHSLTAKDVAEQLEKMGYSYEAVAVSKALRSLAREEEIQAQPGEKPKSAIKYSAPPSLLHLPVQEMRTH